MNIKKFTHITLAAVLVAVIVGCSNKPKLETMPPTQMYNYLRETYNNEKYLDAAEGFEFFTINYGGNALVDSAQYFLGMSHFALKEYILAADAFDYLTRRFPNSQIVPEAMFMVGDCYWELSPRFSLDQTNTQKAIDFYQAFIDYYPEILDKVQLAQKRIETCREKMANKMFANGVIYLKMKNFDSAVIYFGQVIEQYYDTEWAVKSTLKIAESHEKAKKFDLATSDYIDFLDKHPTHVWADQAKAGLERIKNRKKDKN